MGKLKYIDIKNLVNNIKNNTISKIDSKKDLDELTKIRDVEIKHRRLIPGQKELLNLFDKLKIILNDKTLMSSKEENKQLKEENEDEDDYYDYENKNEYEYEYENKNEYEYEYDDDKTIDQNKIKGLNDYLDEIIDKSKSFEEK